ncbi:MAG: helix-turn-helix domain-containing protein [Desulfobacterales bacterium]
MKKDYQKYFEILELSTDASISEIRKSYLRLKDLYSTESIASLPLKDEIPDERKNEILREIEEAYHNLLVLYDNEGIFEKNRRKSPILDKELKKAISDISFFNGQALRQIRERLNINLHDISLATKIQINNIKNLEAENFDALPPDIYTRGFVVSYAKRLSLDPNKVADDYMSIYNAWKKEHKKKQSYSFPFRFTKIKSK